MNRSFFDTLESRCLFSGTGLDVGNPDASPSIPTISVPVRYQNQTELDSQGTSTAENPKEPSFAQVKISNQTALD